MRFFVKPILFRSRPVWPASALAALLATTAACAGSPPAPPDFAVFAEPLLLAGYADLRIERDSPDIGITVFSYKVPPGMTRNATVARVRDQVRQKYPCYEVFGETGGSVQLRCLDVRGQLHGTTEIRTIIGADGQRAFVLLLRSIPADPAVYNDFVSTLDEAVQRAERMK